MKNSVRQAAAVVLLLSLPCALVLLVQRHNKHEAYESSKAFDQLVEAVYFEGEVLSASVYNNTTLLCIKTDTASVDSFYYFGRELALCIREGVAVMPIGIVDKYDSVDLLKATAHRVVLNKGHGGKTLFIRGSDTLQQDLNLWPAKLAELHLLMAWEDARGSICSEKPSLRFRGQSVFQ